MNLDFDPDRYDKRLEKMKLDWREKVERDYLAKPERTHAKLVYAGYWDIAAQLRIDHQSERLAPAVIELSQAP